MQTARPSVILETLRRAGYEAWYVGGCVRDTLLGREIHDWDVTTSALPEQTMACFAHCVPTGIRHGTVTVLEDGVSAEVTTYRTDGSYADGRHPDQVTFVRTLAKDLARRDFTINAMAMDDQGRLVDLWDGQQDLKDKIIRCVGEPERRFREDALRMLRAIRFSAQLEFAVEPATRAAMAKLGHLCSGLSAERIRDELEKTILSRHPEKAAEMAALGLPEAFGLRDGFDCRWLAALPEERTLRWAGLCRCYPELDLTALRLDKQTARQAMTAGRLPVPDSRLGWKQLIAEWGEGIACLTAELAGQTQVPEEILSSGECLSLKQLAVTGKDFPDLTGRTLGSHLHQLLYHVLAYPADNTREKLLELSPKLQEKPDEK